MFTRVWKFTALLLAVVIFVSGCQPTATPSPLPTPTVAPTEVTEQTETEPTGPVEIVPPTEQAVCEVISEAVEPSAVTEKDWVEGASEEDAELTIIEFADFQCPGCAGMAPVMTAFLEAHPEARLVYRHFPLSFHDKAELTAEAAEAAGAQGKFWEMYDLLYTRASEWNGLSVEEARTKMSEYAEELELDVKQFDTELDEDTHLAKIQANAAEAAELGLPGTPTYIFNGQVFPSDMGLSYQALEAFISILDLEDRQYAEIPEMTVDTEKSYEATIATTQGDIVVELFPESAPTLVNTLIFLAEEGWYKDSPFFFVQNNYAAVSGDPSGTGYGHPGYYCMGETQGTIDRPGLMGMTPTGQFFITLGTDAAALNGSFALVGQVTEGLDVAKALTEVIPGDPTSPEPDMVKNITILEK